jgi:putative membrane protein
MLQPTLEKNDSKAKKVIWAVSIIVFLAVAGLSKFKLYVALPFNVHVFAYKCNHKFASGYFIGSGPS